MKRPIFDVLRRGFDNTVANWQLILLRLGETLLMILIAIGALFAIFVPILASIGISLSGIDFDAPEDQLESMMRTAFEGLMGRWMLLFWIVVVITALLAIGTAIHAFLVAGSARIYADADRAAGPDSLGPRPRYRQFSMDRWMAGAKEGWWPIFWIYNLAWGLAGVVLLIPAVPTLIVVLVMRETPEAAFGFGCLGLLATFFLGLLTSIIVAIWSNRAIASWSVRRSGARNALAVAWAECKNDFARVVLAALAVFLVAMAGSSFFGGFSFLAAFGESFGGDSIALFTIPMRMLAWLLSTAFSAAVSAWFLASYCSLATERG